MSIRYFLQLLPLFAIAVTIIGLVLLTLGLRGRPVFSSPRCAKCGYDLRNMQFMSAAGDSIGNCPECGVALGQAGAVTFGKWQQQPRRIVLGVVVIILPWLATFAGFAYLRTQSVARFAAVGPQAKAQMTTPALLASLKTTIDSPWDWQELERRMKAGNLPQADVDAALGVLIADLNAKRAAGKSRQPLHWADRFITPAITSGNASPQQVLALVQAYYADSPKFTMRTRAREGEPILLTLNEHEPWNLPNVQLCWALTDITADGTTKLTPEPRYPTVSRRPGQPIPPIPPMRPDQLSGSGRDGQFDVLLPHSLPPGEHEIALTFELGTVSDRATMRGLDGKPGTPDKWPSPVARWQSVVKRKITVRPKDQSPINVVKDPTSNPFTSASITVEEALARPSSRGVELAIKFKFTGVLSPVVGYRVWVQAGDQKINFGTLVAGRTSRGQTQGGTDRATVKELAADVKSIDILFEPDTKVVEHHTGIEEIWGGSHRIQGVPLQRFDLDDAATTAPSAAGRATTKPQ
jgi:hypothetical protein